MRVVLPYAGGDYRIEFFENKSFAKIADSTPNEYDELFFLSFRRG
jgi:hypothetical protein